MGYEADDIMIGLGLTDIEKSTMMWLQTSLRDTLLGCSLPQCHI